MNLAPIPSLDTRTFKGDTIDLIIRVTRFREGLIFKNEDNLSENDKKNIRMAIGQAVLDVLRGDKGPQKTKTKDQYSVNLTVPYEK